MPTCSAYRPTNTRIREAPLPIMPSLSYPKSSRYRPKLECSGYFAARLSCAEPASFKYQVHIGMPIQ